MSICDAAEFAHAKSIIHRDLKPENAVVGDDEVTVVIDWGLALNIRDEAAKQGNPGPPAR